MFFFHSIQGKIIVALGVLLTVTTLTFTLVAYNVARSETLELRRSQLTTLAEIQAEEVKHYLGHVQSELELYATRDFFLKAIMNFPRSNLDSADENSLSLQEKTSREFKVLSDHQGFSNLYMVDAGSDVVIYAAEINDTYLTSLSTGPFQETAIATFYRQLKSSDSAPKVFDIDPQERPDESAIYFAEPMVSNDKIIGYLIAEIELSNISSILTKSNSWQVWYENSFEIYLVGLDGIFRSESRFFSEEKSEVLESIDRSMYSEDVWQLLSQSNSSIGTLKVDLNTQANIAGLSDGELINNTEFFDVIDYRGVGVYSVAHTIEFPGLDWVMLTEIDQSQDFPGLSNLRNHMLWLATFFIIVSLAATYLWSMLLIKRLNRLRFKANAVADGDLSLVLTDTRQDEIGDLSRNFEFLRYSLVESIQNLEVNVRKKTAALEESEKFSRTIFSQVLNAIIVSDSQGTIVDLNRGAEEIFGYDKAELIGMNSKVLMDPENLTNHEDSMIAASESQTWVSGRSKNHLVALKKNGEKLWISLRWSKYEVEAQKGFIAVIEDVTALKTAEAIAAEKENMLTALIETIPHPIFAKDMEGRYLLVNRAFEEHYKVKRDSFLGKTFLDLSELPESFRQEFFDQQLKSIQNGETVLNEEVHEKFDDGREEYCLYSASPFYNRDCDLAGLLGIGVNVTELKELQALTIHKSKLEALGVIASGIAHEIKQPLNVISLSAANVDLRLGDGEFDRYLSEKITLITDQVARISSIIDATRKFARREEIAREAFNACRMLSTHLSILKPTFSELGINLVLDNDRVVDHDADCFGVAAYFDQALTNVISNAIFELEKLEARERFLWVTAKSDEHFFVVDIEDSAGGIPDGIIDKVFEPFFSTKKHGEGTGLGLAFGREMIASFGGQLSFRNSERGAVFTFKLPMQRDDHQ